jgi:hypothetical protein
MSTYPKRLKRERLRLSNQTSRPNQGNGFFLFLLGIFIGAACMWVWNQQSVKQAKYDTRSAPGSSSQLQELKGTIRVPEPQQAEIPELNGTIRVPEPQQADQ